jgi:hypothetical protein
MFALDQFRSGRFTDRTSEQWAVRESYFIRLHIDRSGKRIHIKSAFHLDAPQPVSNGQLFSRVRARVYSTDGVLMCSAYATIEEDDRTIQPENLKLTFLCMPGMRRFLLDEDSTPLGEFVFAEKPPELKVHVAKPPRRAARWLKVTWKASAPRDAKPGLVFSVRYSADGKEWRPVAVNLTKSELLIDLDRLPGGPECRVQVIASAGFRTTVQESSRFAVPVKGRSIFVQSPSPDATYPSGSPLTLVAAAYSPNFGSAYGDDIQWTSTTLGLLGTGNRLTVPGLPAGKHWIRVHAPDGQGARVSREVPITVVNCAHGSPPRPPFLHRPCRCGH